MYVLILRFWDRVLKTRTDVKQKESDGVPSTSSHVPTFKHAFYGFIDII